MLKLTNIIKQIIQDQKLNVNEFELNLLANKKNIR